MKKYISLIVLLLFVKSGWAQNTNLDFKGAVKFSNQITVIDHRIYNMDKTFYDWQYKNGSYEIFHPAFAFQWKAKNNNLHEIELTDLTIGYGSTLLTSVRYEYIVNLYKLKDWKFVPSLGFGINPYYLQFNEISEVETSFSTYQKYFGVKAFITPRLTYYCGSKVFFDLNFPLCVFDAYYKSYKTDDPTLPLEERSTSSTNFGAVFPHYFSVRLGIGLKF